MAGSRARNPLIIAIFCGALFVLGGTLAGFPVSSGLGAVSFVSALKLLVHSAAMWFATTRIFDVDPHWAAVATLGAALPVAANVFTLARQYDTYLERTASAILVSTTISARSRSCVWFWISSCNSYFVTVSVLLAILGPA